MAERDWEKTGGVGGEVGDVEGAGGWHFGFEGVAVEREEGVVEETLSWPPTSPRKGLFLSAPPGEGGRRGGPAAILFVQLHAFDEEGVPWEDLSGM